MSYSPMKRYYTLARRADLIRVSDCRGLVPQALPIVNATSLSRLPSQHQVTCFHDSGPSKLVKQAKSPEILHRGYKRMFPYGRSGKSLILQSERKEFRVGGGWVEDSILHSKAYFHPEYRPFLYEFDILVSGREKLKTEFIRKRIQSRPHEGLWWSVNKNTHASSFKGTVKTWMDQRYSQAFREVLHDHGFDSAGKPISSSKEPPILRGSLTMQLWPSVLTASFEDLKADCELILGYAIRKSTTRVRMIR
ncbi:hypothetical protein EJ05DRAFT_480533 [Pseudovirgaria hyperparasitica]|uniref:Uncharacterized protein n=1 Tax=Pseudovirgaria hyperparasitica TaxID=470096 RepID=A0A6A6VSA4_9PEZI|nr:uncharacterized protein EJ05DRAFT_480533 [Pseudovirgaria hyperparasitica]KAF2753548.1 hypothetical protein EJ05DRAFT_480533 [Pseudovirgaria hyperparasitica]